MTGWTVNYRLTDLITTSKWSPGTYAAMPTNTFDPSQMFSHIHSLRDKKQKNSKKCNICLTHLNFSPAKILASTKKPQELLWQTEVASNENEFYFLKQCLLIEIPKENARLRQIAKTCEICQNSLSCEWGPNPYFELSFPCFNLIPANQQKGVKFKGASCWPIFPSSNQKQKCTYMSQHGGGANQLKTGL